MPDLFSYVHFLLYCTMYLKRSLILIPIALFSCNNENPVIATQSAYFNAIEKNDITLPTPEAGEWRYSHEEKSQHPDEYIKARPVRVTPGKAAIYLMPVGNFTSLQDKALQETRRYVEIFFQLTTVLLPAVSDSAITAKASRQYDGHTQLLAPYVLDSLLIGKCPADGIALMAISAKDLYPKDDWNYVFGLASYRNRVGVSSIYRLQNEHLDSANYTQCLRRLVNISSHEAGHMLSLHHCIHAMCVMNGSNGMSETDSAPLRLCSECQKKLYWNLRFDNKQRLKQLADFCITNNLQSDLKIFKKDLAALN